MLPSTFGDFEKDKITSTDTNLKGIIESITEAMPPITSATNIEEAIDHAMKQVVVHVGTELLHGNAMLLVSAHELLCHNAMELHWPS